MADATESDQLEFARVMVEESDRELQFQLFQGEPPTSEAISNEEDLLSAASPLVEPIGLAFCVFDFQSIELLRTTTTDMDDNNTEFVERCIDKSSAEARLDSFFGQKKRRSQLTHRYMSRRTGGSEGKKGKRKIPRS